MTKSANGSVTIFNFVNFVYSWIGLENDSAILSRILSR